ncbi:merozoite surface protein 4 [Plasmodium gonderi]|uniref:Merozoite surface protein 4 n=1 Tax=Plasmodium gonderi TaxID=77519 RepID=A0A1Y1JHJ2_PLAGO|nr:merozoite surface protein 4 [Plasmodium gonderi]GAW79544.1 merozoite surface protein 4 [Plasmodium gonderi]
MKVAKFSLILNLFFIFSLYFDKLYYTSICNSLADVGTILRYKRILSDPKSSTTNTNEKNTEGLNSPTKTDNASSSGNNMNGGNNPSNTATTPPSTVAKGKDTPTVNTINAETKANLGEGNNGGTVNDDHVEHYEDYENGDDDLYDLNELDENANLCLDNNGGCGNDKICENLGKGIVKCLCKPGYKLVGIECVKSSKSSSLNSVFCWFLLVIIILASIN